MSLSMKRHPILALLALVGLEAAAQCTPNPLYQDSVFGVWPDTLTDFVSGQVGMFYSDTLNLIVPTNAQDINPNLPAVAIDSVQFIGVTGLPPGLSVSCNSQTPNTCTFLPTMLGCGLIEGIPTQDGFFAMDLNVRGYSNIGGFPIPFDQTFTGYSITIAPAVGIAERTKAGITGVRNVPNPFVQRTTIEFTLDRPAEVAFTVYDLVGAEQYEVRVAGKAGPNRVPFEAGTLGDGIYLYRLTSGGSSFTGRMVLHR